MEPTELMGPIELTEAELRAVAGGQLQAPPPGTTSVLVGILQLVRQSASVTQQGGSVRIG
jgi:hypothetical protein